MRYLGIDPGAHSAIALMEGMTIKGIHSIDLSKIKGTGPKSVSVIGN